MRKSIVRFSENTQLTMDLIAAVGIVVLAHFLLEGKQPGELPARTVAHAVAIWLAVWALRSVGTTITVTSTSLSRKGPFGECRIAWDEMDRLEVGPLCLWLVFHGGGKRIWMRRPMTSMEAWFQDEMDDDHEDPVLTHLMELVDSHGIPSTSGLFTPFKTSRA